MMWLMIAGAVTGGWTLLNVLSTERSERMRELELRELYRRAQLEKQQQMEEAIPTAVEIRSP